MEENRELRVLLLEDGKEDDELMIRKLRLDNITFILKSVLTRIALLCDLGRPGALWTGMAAPQCHKDSAAEAWVTYSRHSKPAP